jgi:hypothetical protein
VVRIISIRIAYKVPRELYSHDVGILKKYGDTYKVVRLKTLRNKGMSLINGYVPKGTAHDEKLECNIRRSKAKIQEYVMCNDWDYFVTLTLDKKKYDRYNLERYHKDITLFIRDINKRREIKVKYLFIPEQHKDGAWHIHGFVSGLRPSDLRIFGLDETLPLYIREKLNKGCNVYEWVKYRERFGFCDLEEIKSKERASSYVRKYITKELAQCVKEIGAHMYYCSKGLNKAQEIKRGNVSAKYNPTYQDEHVSVQWLPKDITEQQARDYIQGNDITTNEIIQDFKQRLKGWDKVTQCNTPFSLSTNHE